MSMDIRENSSFPATMVNNKTSTWDQIYLRKGKVQLQPLKVITWLINLLEEKGLTEPRVLDAGCGTGRNVLPILSAFDNSSAVLFDNSPVALTLLEADIVKLGLKERVDIIELDLDTGLSVITQQFDAVIASLVVHHGYMNEIETRLTSLKEKLLLGGIFIYAAPSIFDPRARTGTEVEPNTFINTEQDDGALPHHYSTSEEIEMQLFPEFEALYRHLARPQIVTGDPKQQASHWEYAFKKA